MTTPHALRLGHRPELDGLRGVAIIAVCAYHFSQIRRPFAGGWLGVNLFFVVSGFLITTLVTTESDRFGSVSLSRFYWRRASRLLPALIVMLIITLVIAATSAAYPTTASQAVTGAIASVFYVTNWVPAITGRWDSIGPFGGLWSLAVEEQFYLVWPVVLVFALRRMTAMRLGWIVAGVAAISFTEVAIRSLSSGSEVALYTGTDAQALGFLLTGCLIALVGPGQSAYDASSGIVRTCRCGVVPALVLLASVAATTEHSESTRWIYRGPTALLAVAMGVLLVAALDVRSVWARLLRRRFLTWFGQISYSLYLWHAQVQVLVDWAARKAGVRWTLSRSFAAAWVASVVVAALSHYLVEQPCRAALNARWERRAKPMAADAATVPT